MAEKKDAAVEKDGSKKKIFIMIGAVVLVLMIGGGFGAWFFMKEKPAPETEKDPGRHVPVPVLKQQSQIGPMVNVDEFIVNIISGDVAHYVKASLTVELSNVEVQTEVEQRMPQMRDAILLLISNKTYEELQDLQGKKQLKAELSSKINSFLQKGQVVSIYFTNFVVQ
ncbi:MAG: flagellar basal body protein FliL [Desulforhopalus sp.]|nr:flagellar basal body protein FliL [Desulforhopalus sp.]